MLICLDKREGPLGIHVLPYCDDEEQCEGLIIKEIVNGGRIDQDGRFAVGDRIIEVNDQTLLNVNFETAQSLIGEALKDDQLKLNIVKNSRKKPTMNYTLPNDSNQTKSKMNVLNTNHFYFNNERLIDSNDVNSIKGISKDKINEDKFNELNKIRSNQVNNSKNLNNQNNLNNNKNDQRIDNSITDSSDNVFNEATPDDYTEETFKFKRNGTFNASNTRRMGKKYHIRLIKDINGLGFSITTRDNQVGQCPIYIKTILPVGAAKKDGNLKGGDRLLEVNGIEITGKSHDEALKVLRDIETGQTVDLIVSRQENSANLDHNSSNHSSFNNNKKTDKSIENKQIESTPNSKLPRQLTTDKIDSNQLDLTKIREVLSFNIPLNDTGSAGLGVSVKGKTSASSTTKKSTDLGIFVKSVFHGGAAFKDGRLKPNDQLISINGISLLNSNNETAMETLKRVLHNNEGVHISSNSINLVVARVTDPLENPNNSLLSNVLNKDELYDTFGMKPTMNDIYHQRNMSTISTDSIKLNFYEQNYQPSEQTDNFMSSNEFNDDQILKNEEQNKLTNKQINDADFNELYNLNRKSNIYNYNNGLISKDSLSNDSNEYTISTPVKTSMKSDFTDNLNELSINKFMNNSNRTDVLIENDDQENNDPNVYRDYFKQAKNEQVLDNSLNKSKDSQMMNLSNVTNQLSLNDEDECTGGDFNFQRDGFGRQSMSEKRYAQLDAKNTDTFKRTKQRKQIIENTNCVLKDKLLPNSNQNTIFKSLSNYETNNNNLLLNEQQRQSKRTSLFQAKCCCFNEPQTYSQTSSQSSCPLHSSSSSKQLSSPKTELTSNDNYSFGATGVKSNFPIDQSVLHYNPHHQQPTPFTLAAQHANHLKQLKLNQNSNLNHFSQPLSQPTYLSRPVNQQTANYQINYNGDLNAIYNGIKNGFNNVNNLNELNKNPNNMSPQFGQWLGMKKSSSLESLQTLMHEAKKENSNYNSNHQPYNTLRRPTKVSRNRNTNESFRTAIDKSYEEYMDNLTMETVNEEFSESGFSITPSSTLNQVNQVTTGKTLNENSITNSNQQVTNNYQSKPSSTSIGTTLSNGTNEISDDEIGLIRRRSTGSSKKKSGILRTLFRFGSKKFKDKDKQQVNSNKLSTPQHIKKELEEEVEKIRARKAALYEQEIIQEYYKRLIDQQKFQQLVNLQVQQRQMLNGNISSTTNTLKKQQDVKNNFIIDSNEQQSKTYNLQSNLMNQQKQNSQQSNLHHSNQIIMKKQVINNYDTTEYLQSGYGFQNRSSGFESTAIENQRPKSSYLAYENNQLKRNVVNQNDFYGYYNDLNRKSFNNSLTNKQHPSCIKDNSIQQFETVHNRIPNYETKEAMQRPGSRIGVIGDSNDDLNNYVIVVRKNSMRQTEISRPYV